jgi:hypothetical protein
VDVSLLSAAGPAGFSTCKWIPTLQLDAVAGQKRNFCREPESR